MDYSITLFFEGRRTKMSERWDAPVFDKALILKYDKAGPRYTSYPTAPYFHEGFDAKAFERSGHDFTSAFSRACR